MNSKKVTIILLSITVGTFSCKEKKSQTEPMPLQNTTFQYQDFRMKKDSDAESPTIQTKEKEEKKVKKVQSRFVEGTDEDGNLVTGEVIIEGNAGLGTLNKKGKNKIDIIVDWSAATKRLIATDENGYLYQLHFR
jgi:hypothetical protein